ncbi:MAG TPA: FAD-binding protein [Streptosporangiaceae bacterium]|nr:FAD-binding protein [Streptosporangiaceae bacterium]
MFSPADVLMAGEVLTPGQDGYEEAAAAAFAVGTPDLIVWPRDPSGVAVAVRYAVGAGLPVSVRSGGHSPAGHSTARSSTGSMPRRAAQKRMKRTAWRA